MQFGKNCSPWEESILEEVLTISPKEKKNQKNKAEGNLVWDLHNV